MFTSRKVLDRLAALEAHAKQLDAEVRVLAKGVSSSAPAQLRAELEDLRGAVELTHRGFRRELGKIWKRVVGELTEPTTPATPEETRAKLRAAMPLPRIGDRGE